MNNVIITNYIESSSLSKLAPPKATARFSTRHDKKSQLSDRHARILAYAQQLRHGNANRSPERNIKSRPRLHKVRFKAFLKEASCVGRFKQRRTQEFPAEE
ncbi:unnamed protein product [Cuscuta europaea]|uniref:Uncharacterized protein n=1 Tax=Cuscuta europaea TaxID=41803 RepID=A0A9P0YZ83_CUSEU|nr:unnamed protein product [Cuscuta europaea]